MSLPWPIGSREGFDGLVLGGRHAATLADEFGTPLVVVDEGHVRARCREFREAFGWVLWAVKAFPIGALMQIALEEGLGVLAATGGEVDACLRAGAPADRVWFHGNNKSSEEIAAAVDAGIGMLIIDNEEEVERVDVAAANAGRVQPVLLRIAPGIDVATHRYVQTGARDTKFGVPVADGLALSALKKAQNASNLRVKGAHVHVGSQLLGSEPYLASVDAALDFLAEARAAFGFDAEVLDIGGGVGVVYTDEQPVDVADLAGAVRDRVSKGCEQRTLLPPTLVAEPGRAVTANAGVTLYRVGTIKEAPGVRTYVAVDGGMSDNIRPALYESKYRVALASRRSHAPHSAVTIVGRHCESGDVLAWDVELPSDITRGDVIAFAATGSYEYAMASNYNKVGRPPVVLVRDEQARLIIRREDSADLARLEVPRPEIPPTGLPEGVRIRTGRPRDAHAVVQLLRAVAGEGRFLRMEDTALTARQMRRRFRRRKGDGHAVFVAVAGREIVGHLDVSREVGEATRHVASIGMAVSMPWRRKGIGAALIRAAIDWGRRVGVEKLGLAVYPHNVAAMGLYRRFGFVEEGRLSGHSKKPSGYEDEIIMGRWL
ncbi:MAG: diaminopimelate decarboxylase [Actinomycetota bacterium]